MELYHQAKRLINFVTVPKEFEAYFKDDTPHVLEFHREEGGRFKVKFVDLPSVGKRASVSVQKGLAMREAIEKLMRGYQTAKNEVFAKIFRHCSIRLV